MASEREVIRRAIRESPPLAEFLARVVKRGVEAATEAHALDPEVMVIVASAMDAGIDGSITKNCTCGKQVWLSPSTQEMLKTRGDLPTEFLCVECLLRRDG